MTKALVDTNILVYAHQKKEEKHMACAELVSKMVENDEIVLSIQNVVEFSRVLAEKSVPSIDKDLVRQYVFDLVDVSNLIFYDSHTVMDALSMSKQYELHFFDALIVATMQENGITEIITENTRDFSRIPWLKATNPIKS